MYVAWYVFIIGELDTLNPEWIFALQLIYGHHSWQGLEVVACFFTGINHRLILIRDYLGREWPRHPVLSLILGRTHGGQLAHH